MPISNRERKWLWRNTFAGQIKCQLQAQRRQAARRAASADRASAVLDATTPTGSDVVLPYRSPPNVSIPLGDRKEDISHDVQNPETTIASQSRPPPASCIMGRRLSSKATAIARKVMPATSSRSTSGTDSDSSGPVSIRRDSSAGTFESPFGITPRSGQRSDAMSQPWPSL